MLERQTKLSKMRLVFLTKDRRLRLVHVSSQLESETRKKVAIVTHCYLRHGGCHPGRSTLPPPSPTSDATGPPDVALVILGFNCETLIAPAYKFITLADTKCSHKPNFSEIKQSVAE